MTTRIHVWYDQDGKIIAVGKPAEHMKDRVEPRLADATHSVLSVDLEDDELKRIHRTYSVDVANAQLKPKE